MTEVIFGSPGCGKTTALLQIVEDEIARGTAPNKISYLTFTKRGAEEAITRACEKFNLTPKQLPHFRTLHSLCFRTLGMRRGDVMEGRKLREFADWAGVRLSGKWSDDGTFAGFESADRILFMENLARVRQVPLRDQYDADDDDLNWTQVLHLSKALAMWKREKGLHDYTDMLSEFVRSGVKLNLEVLIIDEGQDLSKLQWAVVRQLAEGCRRVVVAGDDDQAIYQWAGADAAHLVDMAGDVRVLGQSYRVPRAVQTLANTIISPVLHRREKEWKAKDVEGTVDRAMDIDELDLDGPEILILARNAFVLDEHIQPVLRERGIVWERNNKSSIPADVLAAVTDWERLRRGESVTLPGVRQIYEFMSSDVGYKRGFRTLPLDDDEYPEGVNIATLQRVGGLLTTRIWHEALDRLPQLDSSYILAARRRGERLTRKPRVRLSTIHGSKGGEAEHVILMLGMAPRSYREMESNPDTERRVFYVGVTRAKQRLTIVTGRNQLIYPEL